LEWVLGNGWGFLRRLSRSFIGEFAGGLRRTREYFLQVFRRILGFLGRGDWFCTRIGRAGRRPAADGQNETLIGPNRHASCPFGAGRKKRHRRRPLPDQVGWTIGETGPDRTSAPRVSVPRRPAASDTAKMSRPGGAVSSATPSGRKPHPKAARRDGRTPPNHATIPRGRC